MTKWCADFTMTKKWCADLPHPACLQIKCCFARRNDMVPKNKKSHFVLHNNKSRIISYYEKALLCKTQSICFDIHNRNLIGISSDKMNHFARRNDMVP